MSRSVDERSLRCKRNAAIGMTAWERGLGTADRPGATPAASPGSLRSGQPFAPIAGTAALMRKRHNKDGFAFDEVDQREGKVESTYRRVPAMCFGHRVADSRTDSTAGSSSRRNDVSATTAATSPPTAGSSRPSTFCTGTRSAPVQSGERRRGPALETSGDSSPWCSNWTSTTTSMG